MDTICQYLCPDHRWFCSELGNPETGPVSSITTRYGLEWTFKTFFRLSRRTRGWEGARCSGGNVCICCVKTPWSEDNVFIVLTSYFMGNLSYSSPRWKHRYFASLHPSASAYRISHQMKISKCILIPPTPPSSLPHI